MTRARLFALVRRYGLAAAYVLLSAALLAWVSWEACFVRSITYSPNADYWEHSAVLRVLLDNPWHPLNPHLVSSASSPRFGPQFILIALLGRALRLDALGAMSASAIFNTLSIILGIYAFFRTFFRSELAPVYGLFVLFFSWWRPLAYSNVYQLSMFVRVASYPSTAAIGLTLLGFALVLQVLRSKGKPFIGIGLVVLWAASVLIVHQLTAMLSISGAGLLLLTEAQGTWRRRAELCLALVSGCALSHFWPYFSPWEVMAGGKSDAANWMSQGVQEAVQGKFIEQPHRFYEWAQLSSTLGLCLLGVLALPYFFLQRRRLFVSLGALSMLLPFVVNKFVEIPLGHRFLLLAIFYLQLAVVWLLLNLTAGSSEAWSVLDRPWRKLLAAGLVVLLLAPFAVHNLEIATTESLKESRGLPRESYYVRYARDAGRIAGKNAVILADSLNSWPIPTFGPKVIALRHTNPLVPDEAERNYSVQRFLTRPISADERGRIIEHYGVTHVLIRGQPRGPLATFLAQQGAPHHALTAGYSLYTLDR
ncbi:MAG: hypothetical protein WDO69_26160 [Pseudomonadota bacterium]